MSLIKLENNWYSFGQGLRWRISSPGYLCEVGREGHIPTFNDSSIINSVRRVKSFYQTRIHPGRIDEMGYGIDILVANSFTESGGNVPTPVSTSQLSDIYSNAQGFTTADKLNAVIDYLRSQNNTKSLQRREPGYTNPVSSPNKISLGAHHTLVSTALWLQGKTAPYNNNDVCNIVTRLPAESAFAAQIAILYFEKNITSHRLQPPLLAACYNAGSLRPSSSNHWNLFSTGNHIDKWVQYFNTSRLLSTVKPSNLSTSAAPNIVPPIAVPPSTNFGPNLFSVERIISAMKKRNYQINEDDNRDFNLNLVGFRNPNGQLNKFDDKMGVFWKSRGHWNLRLYTITTEPGGVFINSSQNNGKLGNALGTAILVPGQYLNSHKYGLHKGYTALQQSGNLKVYRDRNMNSRLDYDPSTIHVAGPGSGINIHRANQFKTSLEVNSWSAGCQVFASPLEFKEFLELCSIRRKMYGDHFTYTLMDWSDL